MTKVDINIIKSLVGPIDESQLVNVDSFYCDNMGVFIPSIGNCYYSITPNHSHPSYCAFLQLSQSMDIGFENREPITVKEGCMTFLAPEVVHHEVAKDDFVRFFAILFKKEFFENQLACYNIDPSQIAEVIVEEIPKNKNLTGLCKRFFAEFLNSNQGSQRILEAISVEICHAVIRVFFNIDTNQQYENIEMRFEIENAIEYIHSNFDKKLSVEKIACFSAMSKSNFSKVFKKETGLSVAEYIKMVRMEKAKKMLLNREFSITEIALRCGFSCSSHFSSDFKNFYNQTPKSFRKGE